MCRGGGTAGGERAVGRRTDDTRGAGAARHRARGQSGERLLWEDKDVFTVPTWTLHEHVNTGAAPAFLFSFTHAPVMKALDLYREDAKR